MLDEKQTWCTSVAGRTLIVAGATNEPSHIHIPRPSRLRADGADHRAAAVVPAWSQPRTGEEAVSFGREAARLFAQG